MTTKAFAGRSVRNTLRRRGCPTKNLRFNPPWEPETKRHVVPTCSGGCAEPREGNVENSFGQTREAAGEASVCGARRRENRHGPDGAELQAQLLQDLASGAPRPGPAAPHRGRAGGLGRRQGAWLIRPVSEGQAAC